MPAPARPIIVQHDAATGETVEREMNDAELAQYEADQAAWAEQAQAAEAEAAAKAANREAAIARFKALGFTDAEIGALVLP